MLGQPQGVFALEKGVFAAAPVPCHLLEPLDQRHGAAQLCVLGHPERADVFVGQVEKVDQLAVACTQAHTQPNMG